MTQRPNTPIAVRIRDATDADMAAIQAIYSFYVSRTAASFEEEVPSVEEMKARRAAVAGRGLPFLVAEEEGEVLGYTYAGPFRQRSAYRYTVEDSIYVAPFVVRRGIGRALLSALIERCTALGYRQMIAVIGDSANQGSISVHRAMGFGQEGVLRGVGLKFGRWVDVVIMHRSLGGDDGRPLPDGATPPPLPGGEGDGP
jgi:phosphinothricin acetyltransferase